MNIIQSSENGQLSQRRMLVEQEVRDASMMSTGVISMLDIIDISDLDLVDRLSGGRVDLTYGR